MSDIIRETLAVAWQIRGSRSSLDWAAWKAYDQPGMSGPVETKRGLPSRMRRLAVPGAIVVLMGLAYRLAFWPLHDFIGNAAFLLGMIPCLTAAVWLGWQGTLAAIVAIVLMDRSFALSMPSPETNRIAGLAALMAKLTLAGGLALVVDSRRRVRSLNAQLSESERQYRALVESLGEGVGLFDAKDRVAFANQALASILQRSREELLGKRFQDFLAEESAQAVLRGPQAGPVRSYDVVLAGSASSLLLVTETIFDQGNAEQARTLRVVRDLTERMASERRHRDLERSLQRSQALQSLAVMAGGVAHDFNNLLCGVVGNAEVARRKVPEDAPPVLAQCLSEIIAFAKEAAQLSKQMLAYAGQRSLGIEALDSNAELSNALRLLHATIESKARLVLNLGEGLPEVAADCFQLRQVVTNLMLNALEAMTGQRGIITLRTELVRVDAEGAEKYGLRAGGYIKITVEDTGSGVPPEARDRLFEPFFSTKAPGRGMGLAAAAGIVRAHRGWLGIEATSEQGTRFGILLPVAQQSTPRRSSAPPVSARAPAARNILLIDDEPAVRVVTARLLGELGYRVVTAETGQRGLELLGREPSAIDVIVLDLTMPERSGAQILDEIRRVREDVPVVITSGFQATDASQLLQLPNVVGFLDKPHTSSNLEAILASAAPAAGSDGAASLDLTA